MNTALHAILIRDAYPNLKKCWVKVTTDSGSLEIQILDPNNEIVNSYDTRLPALTDPKQTLALADQLVIQLGIVGIDAKLQEPFGWGWIDGEDENEGDKWIQIGTLDFSNNPNGCLEEEIATLMLRDAERNKKYEPDREAKAKFIVSALNYYIRTPIGLATWQDLVADNLIGKIKSGN
jgi:hypothetical protein